MAIAIIDTHLDLIDKEQLRCFWLADASKLNRAYRLTECMGHLRLCAETEVMTNDAAHGHVHGAESRQGCRV